MSFTSSVFSRLGATAALVLSVVACDRPTPDPVPLGNLPAAAGPVGPSPGPMDDASVATNPFPHDAVTLYAGRIYFLRYNCAGCHGEHGGGGIGPSLRDRQWIYGSDDSHIHDSIAQGRAHGMPAWGLKLPDDVVWKLVGYVQSLRTDREPEPPDQTIPPPPLQ